MKRNYNHIYAKIVEDDNDLVGQIAYSLYKKSKIEYIENQHKGGRTLTDADLIPFNDVSSSNRSIDHYRTKAEQVFSNFIDTVLRNELSNYENQARLQQSEILKGIIRPLITPFWVNLATGILGSLIFAILIAIVCFIKDFGNIHFSMVVGEVKLREITHQRQ